MWEESLEYPIIYGLQDLPALKLLNKAVHAQRTGEMLEQIGRKTWPNTQLCRKDDRFFFSLEAKLFPYVNICVKFPWKRDGGISKVGQQIADPEVRSSLIVPVTVVNWYVHRLADKYLKYSVDRHHGYYTR